MDSSDNVLSVVAWVIVGATLVTAAVLFSFGEDRDGARTGVIQPEAPITLSQR